MPTRITMTSPGMGVAAAVHEVQESADTVIADVNAALQNDDKFVMFTSTGGEKQFSLKAAKISKMEAV